MTWTKPHILLLDEPSNHLDIDACNALIEGLATYKGGVLMVRRFTCHRGHLAGPVWRWLMRDAMLLRVRRSATTST